MKHGFLASALALLCIAPASAQLFDGLSGKKLERAVAKAAAHPFGSKQNPVRAYSPQGERAYLQRLRCADASAPTFERAGSVGIGPYGNILDLYTVTCQGMAATEVYIDMYHNHVESTAVPGYSIEAPDAVNIPG